MWGFDFARRTHEPVTPEPWDGIVDRVIEVPHELKLFNFLGTVWRRDNAYVDAHGRRYHYTHDDKGRTVKLVWQT